MHFVYVLYSHKDGRLYIGYTADVVRRFADHQNGSVRSTFNRRPLKLIYYEAYLTQSEAKRRERYLKGGKGRVELKNQLKSTLKDLGYRFL
jgi:putative endonuclease